VGDGLGFKSAFRVEALSCVGSEGVGLERSGSGSGGTGGTGGGDGLLVLDKLGILGYVESDVRDSFFFFFIFPELNIPAPLFLFPTDWDSFPTSDIAV
jgi:hypothetical protein